MRLVLAVQPLAAALFWRRLARREVCKMAKAARRAGVVQDGGFTLLEALVVVALLSVLLALAVPGLTGQRERQQLQAQAEDFWSSLMLARAQALLHQQHVTVCSASHGVCDPAAGWHSGWLVFVDANRNGQRETDEHMVQQRGATPTAIRITGNSSVNRVIGYGAEGRSESLTGAFQAGTVSVCASGQAQGWQVVINAVGRPRLEKAEMQTCP